MLMANLDRRTMVGLLGAAPFVGGLLVRGQTPAPPAGPGTQFQDIPSRERIRQRYFPNLILTTHEGKQVRFYDDLVKDKIVIFNFMYARCEGICMPITLNLRKVQDLLADRMGRDIFMYSFTLKP